MRRAIALVAVAILGIGIGLGSARAASALDTRWRSAEGTALLFVPRSVSQAPDAPAMLVLVLPGLGGIGRDIAEEFVDAAEDHRWILLAPTPSYDPIANESLESADLRVDDELTALVDRGVSRSPAPIARGVGVVGFSRGAQQAHRFALRHSDRVASLASFSAGTYTMPTSQSPYPFGIGTFELWAHGHPFDAAGLRRVSVLVGVGALDENAADVARAWDAVGGTTRVERAARFTRALKELDVPVRFQLYPKTGHVFTPAMRDDAVTLLRGG